MTDRRWCWTVPLYVVLSLSLLVALHAVWWPHEPEPGQEPRASLLTLDHELLLHAAPPCNRSAPPAWLAIVSSAPNNSFNRQEIRRTWGQGRLVIFVLGATTPQLQPLIDWEANEYGDIVQGSFLDTYRNLTYKHVLGLLWASKHCSAVKYILKADDDVFVNVEFFENYLPKLPERRLILCPLVEHSMVKRSYRSKWRVTPEEYPARWYPNYCSGWVILYSPDVAVSLAKEALNEPYFWIDDVHITGTIAKKLNFTHMPIGDLGVSEVATEEIISGKPRTDFMFSLTKPDNFQTLWNIVNDITLSTTQYI